MRSFEPVVQLGQPVGELVQLAGRAGGHRCRGAHLGLDAAERRADAAGRLLRLRRERCSTCGVGRDPACRRRHRLQRRRARACSWPFSAWALALALSTAWLAGRDVVRHLLDQRQLLLERNRLAQAAGDLLGAGQRLARAGLQVVRAAEGLVEAARDLLRARSRGRQAVTQLPGAVGGVAAAAGDLARARGGLTQAVLELHRPGAGLAEAALELAQILGRRP